MLSLQSGSWLFSKKLLNVVNGPMASFSISKLSKADSSTLRVHFSARPTLPQWTSHSTCAICTKNWYTQSTGLSYVESVKHKKLSLANSWFNSDVRELFLLWSVAQWREVRIERSSTVEHCTTGTNTGWAKLWYVEFGKQWLSSESRLSREAQNHSRAALIHINLSWQWWRLGGDESKQPFNYKL